MKLADAVEALQRIRMGNAHADQFELVVPVLSEGQLGGTPAVAISGIHAGFDWNAGKVLVSCGATLTKLDAQTVEAIRASVARGQSWHAYQAHKALKQRIADLEKQVLALKSAMGIQ